MFLAGISTRSLSIISYRLICRKISPTEISSANVELSEAIEKWRMRDLLSEYVKYMLIDGVNFHIRIAQDIEALPILAAIGITEVGHRLVLSLQYWL
jgi:putative transposase